MPDEAKYIQVDEVGEFLPYLDQFVDALRDIPDDVMLVEVVDGDDHVQVYKEDDSLRIQVEEGTTPRSTSRCRALR
jgi:hypothetical protein